MPVQTGPLSSTSVYRYYIDMICKYPDSATFYKVSSKAYANNKVVESFSGVPAILNQNTGYVRGGFQENTTSDATLFVDPRNTFVKANYNRLEGMYLIVTPFGAPNDVSWYKVTSVSVYKRHLGKNDIDNIELQLKKTEPLEGVS